MPIAPQRQTTHSKIRETDGSTQEYLRDEYFIVRISPDHCFTDGPRLWFDRAQSIVFDPAVPNRRITFTIPKKELWINGKTAWTIFLWGEDTPGGDDHVGLTINLYGTRIGDSPSSASTLFHSYLVDILMDQGVGLVKHFEEGVFPDDPVIEDLHEVVTVEIVHTPTSVSPAYSGKVYFCGFEFIYDPNALQ